MNGHFPHLNVRSKLQIPCLANELTKEIELHNFVRIRTSGMLNQACGLVHQFSNVLLRENNHYCRK